MRVALTDRAVLITRVRAADCRRPATRQREERYFTLRMTKQTAGANVQL